jgi:hypothetical protein
VERDPFLGKRKHETLQTNGDPFTKQKQNIIAARSLVAYYGETATSLLRVTFRLKYGAHGKAVFQF